MKMECGRSIETRQATVERTSEGLVEIRFKPDMVLDAQGIGEVIHAKRSLCVEGEPDVLAVLPRDAEVDLRAVHIDHHALHGPCGNARRLAVVAPDTMNAKLAEIHFRYHPRAHATKVFDGEGDARAWLATGAPQPSLS